MLCVLLMSGAPEVTVEGSSLTEGALYLTSGSEQSQYAECFSWQSMPVVSYRNRFFLLNGTQLAA